MVCSALTEKIVKVLPSMKCPFIIEPHQIQGLDFINIYPLVQWLIKYSSEFREAKEDELRKFAIMQYDKDHIFESDRTIYVQKEKLLRNLCAVQVFIYLWLYYTRYIRRYNSTFINTNNLILVVPFRTFYKYFVL